MDDRDEFLRRFLRNEADLRAFIGSLVLDPHQRDDVFQEVALALWRQIEAYDASRPFGAWARGVAANKVLQLHDRNARTPVAFAPATIEAVLAAYDRTEADASRRADALRDCLKRLPDKSRSLLALRYDEELDAEAIARRTQRTLDAVYQALSRIRALLADCIQQRLAIEERGA